jgi:hypothetical protein
MSVGSVLASIWASGLVWPAIFVIAAAVWYLHWLGVFHPLVLNQDDSVGPIVFLYKPHTGPYHKVGATFDAMEALLDARKIVPLCGLGLYFDNPQQTKAEELRAYCGYSVDPKACPPFSVSPPPLPPPYPLLFLFPFPVLF